MKSDREYITMVSHRYPVGEKPSNPHRTLSVDDRRYQLCDAFRIKAPRVTSCVRAAREAGEWIDFDSSQEENERSLSSSLQLPVYYRDTREEKVMQGVLCLDSNKSDMFLAEEIELWKEHLVGYLVNISLSEILSSIEA